MLAWRDLRGSASLWLAAVSVAVMALLTLVPDLQDRWAIAGGFIPLRFDVAVETPVAMLPAWLTPLSSAFLHANWLHLAFNMLLLLYCGRFVEEAIGRAGLVILYVVGSYAAALAHYWWDPVSIVPVIGASGAVSAILGSYALAFGRPKPVSGNRRTDRAIHAVWLLAFWILIQWMVSVLDDNSGYSIATVAHVGGFVAGLVLLPLLRRKPKQDLR